MAVIAALRPDSWNLPLLLHVLGAMILVGGLLAATSALMLARGDQRLLRLGYFSLLLVAFPGWLLMFVSGEWIYAKEGLDDEPIELAWVLTGFLVAELGGALLLTALILGGIGVHRLRIDKGRRLLAATTIISLVLLVANVVATWAMTAKPV